ncbi:MAG: class I SAM-dependent methyltransferase [Deltaproteobacteria bacterium]|nr:class I SAM-dependent methyltransferase [Deltaproteobacteria bacterium]
MESLRRYSGKGVHEKVSECVKEFMRGTILDAPSGQGALSEDIEALGFKLFLGDIQRENILYRNGRCIQFDLNKSFPFKDGTFDYVVCVEGIEHIENPHHLIKEFARLVRRDGYLVITTPNVMTIKSRLKFLFYGYLDFFEYYDPLLPEERNKTEVYYQQHINPIFYAEMKLILEKCGFKICRVETNKKVKKWKSIYPFIKWLVRKKTKKIFPMDPYFVSDTILEGQILIFIAKHL